MVEVEWLARWAEGLLVFILGLLGWVMAYLGVGEVVNELCLGDFALRACLLATRRWKLRSLHAHPRSCC